MSADDSGTTHRRRALRIASGRAVRRYKELLLSRAIVVVVVGLVSSLLAGLAWWGKSIARWIEQWME